MSKLSVSCPSCAKRYGVPEEHAGKKFKCKDCGATISIPAAAAKAEPEEPAAVDEEEPAPPKRKKSTTHRRPARRRPAPASRRRGTRGRPEEADEEPARAGHRRGGARRPTGGRSSRGRRGAHAHDDEYGGREYGGGQQPNKNLLILSAVACLVLLVALIVIFAIPKDSGTTKKKKKRSVAAKAENAFVPPKIVVNPEDDEPGFGEGDEGNAEEDDSGLGSDPVAKKGPEKKPEKKPKKAEPKKPSLPPIPRAKIRKLEHLESTAAEMRTEIDDAVAVLKDPWAGAKGSKNKRALVKIGKPAVPALLSAMVDLDFTNEDDRRAMPLLTEALQEITKEINSRVCRVGMQPSEAEEIHYCKYFRADWFNWYDGRQGKRFMNE